MPGLLADKSVAVLFGALVLQIGVPLLVYRAPGYQRPPAGPIRTPEILEIVNAASYRGGGIAPGELVTIFGDSLGPSSSATEAPPANVQVLFNRHPAQVLHAANGQVSAVVPTALSAAVAAVVTVLFEGAPSNPLTLPVVASAPGVFSADSSGIGLGAILDTESRLVSAGNPARRGAMIRFYATGVETKLLSSVTIGGHVAKILQAGEKPGTPGVFQIDVVVPEVACGIVPLVLRSGGTSSQSDIVVPVQ